MLSKGDVLVKGKRFAEHRVVGKMNSLLRIWSDQEVDELMLLDIRLDSTNRNDFLLQVKAACESVNFPLTVGGGVKTREYFSELLQSGADKVAICSEAIRRPNFVELLANEFGSQAVVVVIDYKVESGKVQVLSDKGSKIESVDFEEIINQLQELGAGEIVLQNVDREGTKLGLDIETVKIIEHNLNVPLILTGGVGNFAHLREALENPIVSGVACGSLFYFGDNSPIRARAYLRNAGIEVRKSK